MIKALRIILLSIAILTASLASYSFSDTGTTNTVVSGKEMVRGKKNAPVTIIEYASFTCPHCATFHRDIFPKLEKEYIQTGKVRFVYREVYFDAPGLWAALVARCGGEDRYFGIIKLLYEKQKLWSLPTSQEKIVSELLIIARQAGLNDLQTTSCLKDSEAAQSLVKDFQRNVKNDNISSTPSFLINEKLFNNISFEDIKAEIDSSFN